MLKFAGNYRNRIMRSVLRHAPETSWFFSHVISRTGATVQRWCNADALRLMSLFLLPVLDGATVQR